MKKPTLEEVKEYFKDAKLVKCIINKREFNINENIKKYIHTHAGSYWVDFNVLIPQNMSVELWHPCHGYAQIVEYKTNMNCKKEKYAKKIANNTVLDKAQGMEILKDSKRPKRDSKLAISLSKSGYDWLKIRNIITAINKKW